MSNSVDMRFVTATSCAIMIEVPFLIIIVVVLVLLLIPNHLIFAYFVGIIACFITMTTLVLFLINALQFGMDQLHDSSTEDSILFIHWYVWIYYASTFITEASWNLVLYDSFYNQNVDIKKIVGVIMESLIIHFILVLLIISLYVVHYRKVWFLIEPAWNQSLQTCVQSSQICPTITRFL